MSTPHKATAEQWASVRRRAEISGISDCCVIVELAARIEALEREAAMNELRAASAEARPSVKESLTVLPSPVGDREAARRFLREAGFTDADGNWLPQYQPLPSGEIQS